MNNNNKKLVLFDFDGVLANNNEYCYKIHKINNKELTWERFQDFSNGNFHEGFQKALKEENFISIDNFYGHYKKGLDLLTIDDILHDVILSLASSYIIFVVSSTESQIIKDFLEKENLLECFSGVYGHDVHTSKVVKIKSILEKYNKSSESAVFITDTLGDIREANECGVRSVAVTWGLHGQENLEKGNPAVIIDDPQELVGAIENVLK